MVKITNLETGESYIAKSKEDCLDNTDKSAFESAIELNDVVCFGLIIAEPMK